MTLTTSVVICAYTEARWEQLCQAVSSVQAQRRPVDEIIVVIDHNDALLARARVAFSTATVLPNASTQGLSGARNTGIDASTGDIVCFLDDDAAAEEDWSTHLLAPYADRRVLGVGGAATPPGRPPNRPGGRASSAGSWAAAIAGSRPRRRRSGT